MVATCWEDIFGQIEAVSKLKRFISSGNLGHAYLFAGPQGVGKYTTAKVFASAVNCANGGCGKCLCCDKIAREIHPDVFQVAPEGNFITIEQIREIKREANLKPFEANFKVYIIDEVEKMTMEAANALLKILEEPPSGVIFILITSNLEGVISTIVSRCYQVYFRPIATNLMVSEIMRRYETDENKAKLVAKISGGIFGNAIEMVDSQRRVKRRESVLSLVEKLNNSDVLELADGANQLIAEIKDFLDELKLKQEAELAEVEKIVVDRACVSRIKKRLVEKHKRERNKEELGALKDILDVLSSWYRDVLVLTECSKENLLVNVDYAEKLKNLSKSFSLQKAQSALEIIQETRRILRFNVNKQLVLEVMLFGLEEVT